MPPSGTRRISSLVLPAYREASSTTSSVSTYDPMGLPGAPPPNFEAMSGSPPPPAISWSDQAPISPATAAKKISIRFLPRACAIPTPIPAPISAFAIFANARSVFPT